MSKWHFLREGMTWPQGHKTFFMLSSTQLSMEFILLINVKMPTIVGILKFVSRINDYLWLFKPTLILAISIFMSSLSFILS